MSVPDFRLRVQFTEKIVASFRHLPPETETETSCFFSISYAGNLTINLCEVAGILMVEARTMGVPGADSSNFRGSSAITDFFTILHTNASGT